MPAVSHERKPLENKIDVVTVGLVGSFISVYRKKRAAAINMYAYVYIYIYIHVYAYINLSTYIFVYIYICVSRLLCMRKHRRIGKI